MDTLYISSKCSTSMNRTTKHAKAIAKLQITSQSLQYTKKHEQKVFVLISRLPNVESNIEWVGVQMFNPILTHKIWDFTFGHQSIQYRILHLDTYLTSMYILKN
ncbi:unnamed protein product [Owenia fusiformis]|uniref:Uncharacterized protein n=1 Tax=Owenia fusiformis TaxID=6347 RepID=A0A8S4N446_OWEFU|nr:unnamed protein product [Owenia fusiformis]